MNKEQEKESKRFQRLWKEQAIATKNLISQIKADQRQDIKKDLLKIAKRGEMEELRREVENYFEKL